ncbi:MAG: hypothetical protein U1E81_23155 [Xanthobacteraceae bacterium]
MLGRTQSRPNQALAARFYRSLPNAIAEGAIVKIAKCDHSTFTENANVIKVS